MTLHKYLYANANPVTFTDPTGYFSMAGMAMASNIQSSLQNMQIGAYMNFGDVVTGGDAGLGGIPAIAGTAVGLRLLMRFSSKLQKACKNSFDGTTLVATELGLMPIESIKIGDKVWAYNEVNQTKTLQEVTHLIRGEGDKELTDITLNSGEVITATANHPIWEQNEQNWIDAGKLTLDSILLSRYDNNLSILNLREYEEQATVYNLTVNNNHTYFVGRDGVLGHNSGCEYFKLSPHKIRFTQDSIKQEFKNGRGSLEDTIRGLRSGSISPDNFPAIRILEHNGQLWSLDNRRLYVFQQAGIKIKTEVVFMKNEGIRKEFYRKFNPINGGYTINVRGK